MAGSDNQTAQVILWQGVGSADGLRLDSVSGDPEAIAKLFGRQAEPINTASHPLADGESAFALPSDVRTRWQAWLSESLHSTGAETPPLKLQYGWPLTNQTPSAAGTQTVSVLESIWIDRTHSGGADTPPLRIAGHVLILQPLDMTVADVQGIRTGLHKVNNDLPIVSMVLEVVSLKLQQPPTDATRSQLLESVAGACDAIRRAGQLISGIQRRLKS